MASTSSVRRPDRRRRRRRCSSSAATGFRDMFTLPDTGTYTIVVDPRDQQTGTRDVPAVAGRRTTRARRRSGRRRRSRRRRSVRTPSGRSPGTAGQKLTFYGVGQHVHRDGVDFMRASARTGVVGGVVCGRSAATGFRDMFTLPVTGTYTSWSTRAISRPARVTFLLSPVPDNTGTTAIGTPTTVTTTTIGENADADVRRHGRSEVDVLGVGATRSPAVASTSCVRQPEPASSAASLFVLGGDRVPRHVHAARHRDLHRSSIDPRDQQTGTRDVPAVAGARTTRARRRSGRRRRSRPRRSVRTPTRTFAGTAGQKLTFYVSGNTFTAGGVEFVGRRPGSASSAASLVVSGGDRVPATCSRCRPRGPTRSSIDPRDQQTGTRDVPACRRCRTTRARRRSARRRR